TQAASHQRNCLAQASDGYGIALGLVGYLIEAGEFDEAMQRLEKALKLRPGDKDAMILKAMASFKMADYVRAKQVLDDILSKHPGDAQALAYRAEVHLANGDKDLAITDLETARRGEGASPQVALQLAKVYMSMRDFDKAHTVLRSILADRPGYSPALRALVDLCRSNKRWSMLSDALVEAREQYPRDLGYIMTQVRLYRQMGQHSRAVAMLGAVRKVIPETGEVDLQLADILLDIGMTDKALTIVTALRDHQELGPAAMSLRGRIYLARKELAKADAEFVAALKGAKAGSRLAFVVRQLTRAYGDQSVEKIKQWIPLRPNEWQLTKAMVDLLMMKRQYKQAQQYLKKGLTFVQDEREKLGIYRQLGLAHQQMAEFEPSRQAYVSALAIRSGDEIALNNLAWLLAFEMGKVDDALPMAKRAVDMSPFSPQALDTYGAVLAAKGRYDQAERILNRSIDIKAMPVNKLHLGEVYEKMKRPSDALRAYRAGWQLVNKSPDNPYFAD
ncbi:hypothetical protein LCGC14_2490200, partial [marine sediment metagenome]